MGKVQRFGALLEAGDRALGWTIARVPFDPAKVWTEMVRLRVRGSIAAGERKMEFRTSLFADHDPGREGGFYLLVNRAMQEATGLRRGAMAEFRLEPDLAAREAALPDELAVLLDEAEGLREWYEELTEYTRREIGRWVIGVKSDEARMRRAEQMAERLLSTMEAEVELPPVIMVAFRERPKAKAGWAKMTPARRRAELMGVFYYQGVEARAKRVERLCEVAEKKA